MTRTPNAGAITIGTDVTDEPTAVDYATDDPETAFVEWSVFGKVLPNANSYHLEYATFVTFRGGLITNDREY